MCGQFVFSSFELHRHCQLSARVLSMHLHSAGAPPVGRVYLLGLAPVPPSSSTALKVRIVRIYSSDDPKCSASFQKPALAKNTTNMHGSQLADCSVAKNATSEPLDVAFSSGIMALRKRFSGRHHTKSIVSMLGTAVSTFFLCKDYRVRVRDEATSPANQRPFTGHNASARRHTPSP
jgi:hypothetical protein